RAKSSWMGRGKVIVVRLAKEILGRARAKLPGLRGEVRAFGWRVRVGPRDPSFRGNACARMRTDMHRLQAGGAITSAGQW
ncbi:MAG TPA: hypothetical protein PKI03_23440, partial [Pseudomonadota bacterium]|nr:hypothetical protein [Pseudomonadota bacterium]